MIHFINVSCLVVWPSELVEYQVKPQPIYFVKRSITAFTIIPWSQGCPTPKEGPEWRSADGAPGTDRSRGHSRPTANIRRPHPRPSPTSQHLSLP